MLSHYWALPNKWYVVFLGIAVVVGYSIHNALIPSVYQVLLSILPFQRLRAFTGIEVPQQYWIDRSEYSLDYSVTYSLVLTLVLVVLVLRNAATLSRYKVSKRLSVTIGLLLLFLLVSAVPLQSSKFFYMSLFQYGVFFSYVVLFLCSLIIHKQYLSIRITAIILGTISVVLIGLIGVQFLNGSQLGTELEQIAEHSPAGSFQSEARNKFRPGGFFFDPNAAATWLITAGSFAVYALGFTKKMSVRMTSALIATLCAGLVLTSSRFSWIVAVVLVGLTIFVGAPHKRLRKAFSGSARIVLLGTLLLLSPLIISRLSDFSLTFSQGGGYDYRMSQIGVALQYAQEIPQGVGIGMLQLEAVTGPLRNQYIGGLTQPHNMFAEIASASGFLGAVIFFLFLCSAAYTGWYWWKRDQQPEYWATLIGVAAYVLMAQAYPYFTRSPVSDIFWVLLGIVLSKDLYVQKHKKMAE